MMRLLVVDWSRRALHIELLNIYYGIEVGLNNADIPFSVIDLAGVLWSIPPIYHYIRIRT